MERLKEKWVSCMTLEESGRLTEQQDSYAKWQSRTEIIDNRPKLLYCLYDNLEMANRILRKLEGSQEPRRKPFSGEKR